MSESDWIARIDRLRALPTETEWVEFKSNHVAPDVLGRTISALANAACWKGEPHGYLLFGIDDGTHAVRGTTFDPYAAKGKGSEPLLSWLGRLLEPNPGVDPRVVPYRDRLVVVMTVGAARDQPIRFSGKASIRIGSSVTDLKRHPEIERAIWANGRDWSADLCYGAKLVDLDPVALVKGRTEFGAKHPLLASDAARWDDTTFLRKARLLRGDGALTNAAALLLGRRELSTALSPAVAQVTWILKDAENRDLDYAHFEPPLLLAGDRLLERIRNLTVRTLPHGTLFPVEFTQYDPWVIREALHNCIAHQDYTRHGRITVVEFPDRLLFTNVGTFLPGSVEEVIRRDAPHPIYRNPLLAGAMVDLNLIDTRGGGIRRMFETQRRRSFPLPDYDIDSTPGLITVTLSGRILDERFTRMLMERSELPLEDVIALDRVQKRRPITREEHRRLKSARLVEGRFPNLLVSATIARIVNAAGKHVRDKGLGQTYYLDLIMRLVEEHGPVTRRTIDDAVLPTLPDRLNLQQRRWKIGNLLRELKREGRLVNSGSRARPQWVAASLASKHVAAAMKTQGQTPDDRHK